jgi:hypothetical protein
MSRPKLVLLNDDGKNEINVFIHGYGLTKEKFYNFAAQVNSLELRGRVYLLFWEHGSWSLPKHPVLIAQLVQHPIITGGFGLGFAIGKLIHFNHHQSRAENIGAYLLRHIAKIPNAREFPINLIGFSLGARVIHWALKTNSWANYKLRDVILLGGATNSQSGDWVDCTQEVNGTLYNIYSPNDQALRFKPGPEICVGRCPIPSRHPQIKNFKCSLAHKEYMPKLEWLFDQKFPNRRRSSAYRGWMHIICPWCKEDIRGIPYVPTHCQGCALDFVYHHRNSEYRYSREFPEPIGIDCPDCGDYTFPVQQTEEYECPKCESQIWFERHGNRITYQMECEECEGRGEIECGECNGSGYVECDDCEGDGKITCGYCKGDGCGHCEGSGVRACRQCVGDGKVECPDCQASATVQCSDCNGEGETTYTN